MRLVFLLLQELPKKERTVVKDFVPPGGTSGGAGSEASEIRFRMAERPVQFKQSAQQNTQFYIAKIAEYQTI